MMIRTLSLKLRLVRFLHWNVTISEFGLIFLENIGPNKAHYNNHDALWIITFDRTNRFWSNKVNLKTSYIPQCTLNRCKITCVIMFGMFVRLAQCPKLLPFWETAYMWQIWLCNYIAICLFPTVYWPEFTRTSKMCTFIQLVWTFVYKSVINWINRKS